MMEVIGKISIAEVILLFLLLFVLPTLFLLVMRLRKYEAMFGQLPKEAKRGKKKKKKDADEEQANEGAAPEALEGYPYRSKTFLSPADRACLVAMREALGPDVDVFPKVALWETVEPTEKDEAYRARLSDKCYDFLVCDKATGKALTAVMYKPGRGRPAGGIDELKNVCKAAEANVVFIDMAEKYDGKSLKDALGIPELDL